MPTTRLSRVNASQRTSLKFLGREEGGEASRGPVQGSLGPSAERESGCCTEGVTGILCRDPSVDRQTGLKTLPSRNFVSGR